MAVTLASSSTTNNLGAATASLVLTKPTGLAVGDIILALFGVNTSTAVTKPSGWATHASDTTIAGGASAIYLDYKIADSSDVAASDFTWSFTSSVNSGVIMRVTGGMTDHTKWKSAASSGTNTLTPSLTGVTPTTAYGNLLIEGLFVQNAGTTLSGWAIATNDPGGWTELQDVAQGSIWTFGVAWALRNNQTSATGNGTVTLAADNTNQWGGILIAIPQYIDFTITDTVTTSEARTFIRAMLINVTDVVTTAENITNTVARVITNIAKNVASWINQNKS